MERTSKLAAAILGIIGGAVLILGSLLTWVTLSFDSQRFAQEIADAVGVDVSELGTIPALPTSSETGTAADGKYTLIAGVVVLVCGVLLLVSANARSVASKLMILGGVVGAGVPLYNVVTTDAQLDRVINDAGGELVSGLDALGLSTDVFKDAVTVEWGIGVWVCIAGGVVALVAGIMAARSPAPAVAAPVAASGWAGTDVAGTPPAVAAPAQVPPVGSEPVPPLMPAPIEAPPLLADPVPPAPPEDPTTP